MGAERWRVGRTVGRTIYVGDRLIGLMDTPELAQQVVEAVNAAAAPTILADDLEVGIRRSPHDVPYEPPRGVWMRHRPTGVETSCSQERSQLMNKVRCLEEIRAALAAGVPAQPPGEVDR